MLLKVGATAVVAVLVAYLAPIVQDTLPRTYPPHPTIHLSPGAAAVDATEHCSITRVTAHGTSSRSLSTLTAQMAPS